MDLIKKDKLVRINILIISFILGVGLQSGFSQSLSEKISVPWVENEKISFKQEIYEIPRIGGQDYDGCRALRRQPAACAPATFSACL